MCQISNSLITRLLAGRTTAKLRLPPQNRSLSICLYHQTATLIGSDDRTEPIYFQHTSYEFLAEKKSFFFVVWVPPRFPLVSRPLPDQKKRKTICLRKKIRRGWPDRACRQPETSLRNATKRPCSLRSATKRACCLIIT